MKKFYTFIIAAFCASTMMAQVVSETFQFVDKSGNVVADGSELTFSDAEEDDFGDMQVPMPLQVKNTSDATAKASASVQIVSIDNGNFSCCAFGNCMMYSAVGTYQRSSKDVAAGATENLQTEWCPASGNYGQCTVKMTLQEEDMGEKVQGPTVTMHFVYKDPASVEDVKSAQSKVVVARYATDGSQLSRAKKGINIVRYADGHCAKVVF